MSRLFFFLLLLMPDYCLAESLTGLERLNLSYHWAIPFVAILLSIAFLPLLAPQFWHRRYGQCIFLTTAGFMVALAYQSSIGDATAVFLHATLKHYIPFMAIAIALYTVAGGIRLSSKWRGLPWQNTLFLAVGTFFASWIGTTGASVLLIRPLLAMNHHRAQRAHIVLFFIFLVSNVGGSLTPIGDPPLFLGFLSGVDFFWPMKALWQPTLMTSTLLLALFFMCDSYIARKNHHEVAPLREAWTMDGKMNLLLLVAINGFVLLSGVWEGPLLGTVAGIALHGQDIARDGALLLIAFISYRYTPARIHKKNEFSWAPIGEVAKIFFGIFITVTPLLAFLKQGTDGPLGSLVSSLYHNGSLDAHRLFWTTGALSSFLDNAPTYLIFFNLAGGDPNLLMFKDAHLLAAISMGAVFLGAMTYIGNAPNFMVKAIAEHHGVRMPGFITYMCIAILVLLPIFWIVSSLFLG